MKKFALGPWWIFFAEGAEKVRELNLTLMLGQRPQSIRMIKVFAAVGVIMFPLWVFMTMQFNAPLPKF